MIKDNYEYWVNNEKTDELLVKELKAMNDTQINDAFYTNIEFGTAGMRGVMGAGTNKINIHTIRKANYGFVKYIISKGEKAKEQGIAIGYDNRHNSYKFALDSARFISGYGVKVYLFKTLAPTPELSFAVRYYGCAGGIMITASHNTKEYNGYKIYDETGCQLVPHLASQVVDYVNSVEDLLTLEANPKEELINYIREEVDEAYYNEVLKIRLNANVNKDIKVVFSPEHGASYLAVKETLTRAGYNVIIVEEQAIFDGDFPNTKTPNPEDEKAYELSLKYANENEADLILVCDPDGDRMGVGIKHNNEYVILNGNQTGALLMEYVFSQMTLQKIMPENPVMFNTVVTSDIGEAVANHYKVRCEKTLTGFKFIGEKVQEYIQNGKANYVFGYEESYGSLAKPFVRDKDATQACILLAEACAYYKNHNKTLMDIMEEIYQREGYYLDSQTSIVLPGQQGADKLKEIIISLRNNPLKEVCNRKVVKYQDYGLQIEVCDGKETKLEGFSKSDVLKYYLDDGSFIAVRPSGTEPKCKIYYSIISKDPTNSKAKLKDYNEFMLTVMK